MHSATGPRSAFLGSRTLGALAASYPLVALVPCAGVYAWHARREPGVRFALAWLLAGWLLLELRPAANIADALLFFPPLAGLCAGGWRLERSAAPRWLGAGLAILSGAALAAAVLYVVSRYGDREAAPGAVFTVVFIASSAVACAFAVIRRRVTPLVVAAALITAGQALMVGVLAPSLSLLWPSQRVVAALDRLQLDPSEGLVVGPVAVAGYDEPSLVFSLGARTEFSDARAAARAIVEGRPAVVEASQQADFAALLKRYKLRAQAVATVRGLDYAENRPVTLTIWRKIP